MLISFSSLLLPVYTQVPSYCLPPTMRWAMGTLIPHLRKLRPWEYEETGQAGLHSKSHAGSPTLGSNFKGQRLRCLESAPPVCEGGSRPHLLSRIGPIFCRDLATLKRTLATGSPAIRRTVGSMCLVVMSCPHTSDSTWGR